MSDKLQFSEFGYSAGVKERVDYLMEEVLRPNNLIDNSERSGRNYSMSFERTKRHARIANTILLATAPLIAVSALATRMEDGNPAFYNAQRVDELDENGAITQFLQVPKVRSMYAEAASAPAPLFKVDAKHDPRVTKTGRITRKLSIDELPQLMMVSLRQMSLVGPRGNTVFEHRNPAYQQAIGNSEANAHRRLVNSRNMKGLTSLAVIAGSRAVTSTEDIQTWVASELIQDAYCSPELDNYVLTRTPLSMFCEKPTQQPAQDAIKRITNSSSSIRVRSIAALMLKT